MGQIPKGIWQINQSKQPEKFRKAAYCGLSKEVCGSEDFIQFLADYVSKHRMDDKMKNMLQQYMDGGKYIKNNNTK